MQEGERKDFKKIMGDADDVGENNNIDEDDNGNNYIKKIIISSKELKIALIILKMETRI